MYLYSPADIIKTAQKERVMVEEELKEKLIRLSKTQLDAIEAAIASAASEIERTQCPARSFPDKTPATS